MSEAFKIYQDADGENGESGPRLSTDTVAYVLDWYGPQDKSTVGYIRKERERLRSLFRESYGHLKVSQCRKIHLHDFILSLPGVRSNWTKRRVKATINKPFNEAVDLGLIDRNPFRGLKIPEGGQGRDWTDEEYAKVLRTSAPFFRRFVVFLRFSGARPGEARNLEWDQIREDLGAIIQSDHKTAHITQQARRIYFNHVIIALLKWLARNKTSQKFVFTNKIGRPWTLRALTNHMGIIRKRAGLPAAVRLHGGRHTFATRAILNDVNIVTLAELLGHRSTKTTERYLHLAHKRAHLNDAMERAIKGNQ